MTAVPCGPNGHTQSCVCFLWRIDSGSPSSLKVHFSHHCPLCIQQWNVSLYFFFQGQIILYFTMYWSAFHVELEDVFFAAEWGIARCYFRQFCRVTVSRQHHSGWRNSWCQPPRNQSFRCSNQALHRETGCFLWVFPFPTCIPTASNKVSVIPWNVLTPPQTQTPRSETPVLSSAK